MIEDVPILTRALQLAESGQCTSVNHVKQTLRREGYGDIAGQLAGADVNSQIIRALHDGRARLRSRPG